MAESTKTDHDRLLFNTIASQYARKDMVRSSVLVRRYELFFALSPFLRQLGSQGIIIDIGCGIGAPAIYLRGHYGQYIGIDHSEKMIENAQCFHHGNDKVSFLHGDVTTQSFQTPPADLILANGALHHMTHLEQVFQNIGHLARPGAFFIALEPQAGNPAIQLMRWLRGKVDPSYSRDQHYFKRAELFDLLHRHGLHDIALTYQGYFSTPFGQIILPYQPLAILCSRIALSFDRVLDQYLPSPLRFLSWHIIARARFP
ncbi:class I SAM-dependent methyltransferase [candidate division CSSED10-310 bacterium]|uniref:Class I SAM-dependent methyltransferase n=1 Tax=candidate division CSSED10-310 bacterium TaxID=2855610 RepID=A0ABV6Z5A8_UNCC1